MKPLVLIVDDSLTVRMDLAEAFHSADFEALQCSSVKEARKALAGQSCDLVVLDILLPDGDGFDFLREIRSSKKSDIPVMLLSSEAEARDRIKGLKKGADEYVGKPYDRSYVVSRARQLLRHGDQEAGGKRQTVLVIDDSSTFRSELQQALEKQDYGVMTAASGEEGLRMAADLRPSAVVVDGVLPGIDGATVIRRIRLDTALRQTLCVLLTGSEEQGAELKALEAGADAFVRKEEDIPVVFARLAAALRKAPESTSQSAVSLLGPKKILAVDDSLTYLHELTDALRGEGYDVAMAKSGEEALELLAVQAVDCILLDLLMPGLSGQETCRRIKAAPFLRDIPVIMLTAMEDRNTMIEGLIAGADDYISKSSDLEILRARVRAQLRRRQFEGENRRIREQLLRVELEAAEARAARELAETRAALIAELERKNRELETFSYSVSHDLRAPLRSIDGFSQALVEDYGKALDEKASDYLRRIRGAAQRMGELIDDLLQLSRIGRMDLNRESVDLSAMVTAIVKALQERAPERQVEFRTQGGLVVEADPRLLKIALENLLGNAWKFTGKTPRAMIEVGTEANGRESVYYVKDNGAGFDMEYAAKLFAPFQRLHKDTEFPGTGIGLATVYRIVDRHGGRIWVEASPGAGATFRWTIPLSKGGEAYERTQPHHSAG
ncbi:MAG: response regulator [Bdellovibrionota bacterium]